MKKREAFTLAEALSSIMILAFIVGTLLPMLTVNSKITEYKAGYQRAINNLNSAYANYLQGKDKISDGSYLDPLYIGNYDTNNASHKMNTSEDIVNNLFKKYLSTTDYEAGTFPGCVKRAPIGEEKEEDVEDPKIFYTTDGMRYCVIYDTCTYNQVYADSTCGEIWVDVNGKDGPNQIAKSNAHPADIYPIAILKDRFIPGRGTVQESADAVTTYAQNLYFGVN